MKKVRTSFALSHDVIELLKLIAEKHDRSQANMFEVLVREAAIKEKIKLPKA